MNLTITSGSGAILKHRLTNASLGAGTQRVNYAGWGDNGRKLGTGSYLVQVDAVDSAGRAAHAQKRSAFCTS